MVSSSIFRPTAQAMLDTFNPFCRSLEELEEAEEGTSDARNDATFLVLSAAHQLARQDAQSLAPTDDPQQFVSAILNAPGLLLAAAIGPEVKLEYLFELLRYRFVTDRLEDGTAILIAFVYQLDAILTRRFGSTLPIDTSFFGRQGLADELGDAEDDEDYELDEDDEEEWAEDDEEWSESR